MSTGKCEAEQSFMLSDFFYQRIVSLKFHSICLLTRREYINERFHFSDRIKIAQLLLWPSGIIYIIKITMSAPAASLLQAPATGGHHRGLGLLLIDMIWLDVYSMLRLFRGSECVVIASSCQCFRKQDAECAFPTYAKWWVDGFICAFYNIFNINIFQDRMLVHH